MSNISTKKPFDMQRKNLCFVKKDDSRLQTEDKYCWQDQKQKKEKYKEQNWEYWEEREVRLAVIS